MNIDVAGILFKGTLTLSVALAASWTMRERPASLRHFILALGFASLVAIPFAAALAPSIALSLPALGGSAEARVEIAATTAERGGTRTVAGAADTVERAVAP